MQIARAGPRPLGPRPLGSAGKVRVLKPVLRDPPSQVLRELDLRPGNGSHLIITATDCYSTTETPTNPSTARRHYAIAPTQTQSLNR